MECDGSAIFTWGLLIGLPAGAMLLAIIAGFVYLLRRDYIRRQNKQRVAPGSDLCGTLYEQVEMDEHP